MKWLQQMAFWAQRPSDILKPITCVNSHLSTYFASNYQCYFLNTSKLKCVEIPIHFKHNVHSSCSRKSFNTVSCFWKSFYFAFVSSIFFSQKIIKFKSRRSASTILTVGFNAFAVIGEGEKVSNLLWKFRWNRHFPNLLECTQNNSMKSRRAM